MKIYSLEFISLRDGAAERIWHTNRRALERYATTLQQTAFQVRDVTAHELPAPLTEARLVAFLNSHCRAVQRCREGEPAAPTGWADGAPPRPGSPGSDDTGLSG